MKNMILASIAAGGLAVLVAGPAAAENADAGASASGSFTAKNVNRIRPFGSINTYNVGLAPARVSAWAKTLSADQNQEMFGPLLGDHPESTELLFGNDHFLPELRHRDSGTRRGNAGQSVTAPRGSQTADRSCMDEGGPRADRLGLDGRGVSNPLARMKMSAAGGPYSLARYSLARWDRHPWGLRRVTGANVTLTALRLATSRRSSIRFHAPYPSACFTRSGVIGVCRRRTPAIVPRPRWRSRARPAASPSGRHRSDGCWSGPPR